MNKKILILYTIAIISFLIFMYYYFYTERTHVGLLFTSLIGISSYEIKK